jgi:hypothetical protein
MSMSSNLERADIWDLYSVLSYDERIGILGVEKLITSYNDGGCTRQASVGISWTNRSLRNAR